MITKFIGIKELRQNMAKITQNALKKKERLIVFRRNKPLFELRPLSDKEVFEEYLRRDLDIALDQVKKGNVFSQEEVEKSLGL